MATHSSVLAWRIPGMGELGGLPSVGSHRVRHDGSDLAAAAAAAFSYSEANCEFVIISSISFLNLRRGPAIKPWRRSI